MFKVQKFKGSKVQGLKVVDEYFFLRSINGLITFEPLNF
jgi:hypothetical protein